MYTITINEDKKQFERPMMLCDIIEEMCGDVQALGCLCGGSVMELNAVVDSNLTLVPITFMDEEGRRIYERSLRFVLLLAAKRLFPEYRIRIDNSLGYGVYMHFIGYEATDNDLKAIENEMRRIVDSNLPFTKETWSREEALKYFAYNGENDKVHLLTYRPYDYFTVYCLDGMYEYFYGSMLPSTGKLQAFALWKCLKGFVMQMPSPADPSVPAEAVVRPHHIDAFEESNRWCRLLGCSNVADLNDMIRSGKYREFIRINEALQSASLSSIADDIYKKEAKAVFIAGPSSSGKTTFANRLRIQLKVLGLSPVLISLDDFYRNRDDIPLEADGMPDLEALSALDVPYLQECLDQLLSGKEAMMPRFSFQTHSRESELYPMRLRQNEILLVEGIHGLNPSLHEKLAKDKIYKIFISELTCLNLDNHNRIRTTDARLMRRIVRDYQFRRESPEDTISMWGSVRNGEEKWIFPYQEQADWVFNSALHYELPILRNYAYDLLKAIPPESPNIFVARRLLKILHYMLPAPEDALKEVPPTSLLKEFIGGNTFYD